MVPNGRKEDRIKRFSNKKKQLLRYIRTQDSVEKLIEDTHILYVYLFEDKQNEKS